MLFRSALLIAIATVALAAQNAGHSFTIDKSKPYVYLKFDHIADRRPLSHDEVSKGLWLHLVNNCRLPIIVAVFNPGTADAGTGVFDAVVPLGDTMGLPLAGPAESPKPTEHPKPPEGYSSEVFSTRTVAPRGDLLFSVPLNHVSPWWHMQIMFNFDVGDGGHGSEPYSVVSFYWQDIPEKLRVDLRP